MTQSGHLAADRQAAGAVVTEIPTRSAAGANINAEGTAPSGFYSLPQVAALMEQVVDPNRQCLDMNIMCVDDVTANDRRCSRYRKTRIV
jgi:hypothetical protein